MSRAKFSFAAVILAALLAAPPARAAVPPHHADGPDPDSWRFSLTLYGWLAGMDGSLSGGQDGGFQVDADVDVDVSDAIDNIDSLFGLMGHVEARRGPLSVFGDVLYLTLEADGETRLGGESNVDVKASIVELGVAYEVYRAPVWGSSKRHFGAEVLGGARYAGVDVEVDVFTAAGGQLSADGRKDWIDPFVGLRGRLDITDNLYTFARGDVGGFGVGSDFVWNANLGVGFEITDNFDIAAGYRWLDYDFEEGDFTFDLQIAGPWIALVFKF
jgi:hypothetical protein